MLNLFESAMKYAVRPATYFIAILILTIFIEMLFPKSFIFFSHEFSLLVIHQVILIAGSSLALGTFLGMWLHDGILRYLPNYMRG